MKPLTILSLMAVLAVLSVPIATAQPVYRLSVKNSTLAATDSVMPFWFAAGNDGKISPSAQVLNITDVFIGLSRDSGSAFGYTTGVNLVAGLGETSYYQLNRAFAGITWKGWALTGGMFYDDMQYAGLSATNGNLARSRNARPYPRIRFGTKGYKPVPLLQSRLSFRAEYDEGLLNDHRFVDNAHLHHKSLYLRLDLSAGWEAEGGLEHFVMWGGTSPVETIGKMPSGFKSYLHYVTGRSGSDDFPMTDQLNVAGNQLGTYQFRLTKRFADMNAAFYLSHPFEDLSGMNWRNWPDNLLGLHLSFNDKSRFITGLLYEFTNTRQQSIRGDWDRQEPDSYYNNGVYRSGFTYHRQMMGSPLFPVVVSDGISRGIGSNMLLSHHLGMRGRLREHLHWKSLLTWMQHEGKYFSRYEPVQKQVSGLLELQYLNPALPVQLALSAAADAGNASGRNAGVWVSVRWEVNSER